MKRYSIIIFAVVIALCAGQYEKISAANYYFANDAIVYESDNLISTDVTISQNVYIKKGVTITIEKNCTVTFCGNIYIWGTLENYGTMINNATTYCLDYNGFIKAGENYDYGYLKNHGTFERGTLNVNDEYLSIKIPDKQESLPTATPISMPTATSTPMSTVAPIQTSLPTSNFMKDAVQLSASDQIKTPEPQKNVAEEIQPSRSKKQKRVVFKKSHFKNQDGKKKQSEGEKI